MIALIKRLLRNPKQLVKLLIIFAVGLSMGLVVRPLMRKGSKPKEDQKQTTATDEIQGGSVSMETVSDRMYKEPAELPYRKIGDTFQIQIPSYCCRALEKFTIMAYVCHGDWTQPADSVILLAWKRGADCKEKYDVTPSQKEITFSKLQTTGAQQFFFCIKDDEGVVYKGELLDRSEVEIEEEEVEDSEGTQETQQMQQQIVEPSYPANSNVASIIEGLNIAHIASAFRHGELSRNNILLQFAIVKKGEVLGDNITNGLSRLTAQGIRSVFWCNDDQGHCRLYLGPLNDVYYGQADDIAKNLSLGYQEVLRDFFAAEHIFLLCTLDAVVGDEAKIRLVRSVDL
jgi:hypothetical protein